MQKILMVCLGNICRSPMAEGIVRKVFADNGINVQVDSAGTSAFHQGQSADPRALAELRKYDIDISDERAQQFLPIHFSEYDSIFTMDSDNYADVLLLASNKVQRAKVDMIMNISSPGKNIAVPDPYYGDDDGFANVYKMINEAALALVKNY